MDIGIQHEQKCVLVARGEKSDRVRLIGLSIHHRVGLEVQSRFISINKWPAEVAAAVDDVHAVRPDARMSRMRVIKRVGRQEAGQRGTQVEEHDHYRGKD